MFLPSLPPPPSVFSMSCLQLFSVLCVDFFFLFLNSSPCFPPPLPQFSFTIYRFSPIASGGFFVFLFLFLHGSSSYSYCLHHFPTTKGRGGGSTFFLSVLIFVTLNTSACLQLLSMCPSTSSPSLIYCVFNSCIFLSSASPGCLGH